MVRSIVLLSVVCMLCFIHDQSVPVYSQSAKKYWVYFVDKGPSLPSTGAVSKQSSAYKKALEYIQPRALARRSKVMPSNSLIEFEDLPLYGPYLEKIKAAGGTISQQSRWLNAASFYITAEQVRAIAGFSFVRKVEPVVIIRGNIRDLNSDGVQGIPSKAASLDYGLSLNQNQMINVPPIHDLGITGKNVIIGMLDSGFRWRDHEALQTRRVIAERDFIFNDDTTANQSGDAANQDGHGTLTFSVVGGFKPGKLIGPAHNAEFILAKTEYVPSETQIEEDNWVAAIEWMEALGIDVASSSLGYNIFDDGTGYTWADSEFDGRTAVTSKAAVRAARLGVVVCDAMGNEGNGDGVVGTMLAPADADSIISVGAITFSRRLASFSSTGPTNDNRIKPDVVAPGAGVYCAVVPGPNSYSNISGTSLSTPLVAGTAALLLSARPELTPIQVRDALRNTADTIATEQVSTTPNNFVGWGLINAFNVALSFGPIFSNEPAISLAGSASVVAIHVVSKFGLRPDSVLLYYRVGLSTLYSSIPLLLDSAMFFPTSGRYKVVLPHQEQGTLVRFYITAIDSGAYAYQSPAEITGNIWELYYGVTGVNAVSEFPSQYKLWQNYPNPFNPRTTIRFELPRREYVSLKVYDVLGREITTLIEEVREAGNHMVEFDMADVRRSYSGEFSSGVYFYRMVTPTFNATNKMLLLR